MSEEGHHRGEATVCAWTEVHGGTAIIDDRDARRAASAAGLDVHGTAWLLARAVATNAATPDGATSLIAGLTQDGARYPFSADTFLAWASSQKLLEP